MWIHGYVGWLKTFIMDILHRHLLHEMVVVMYCNFRHPKLPPTNHSENISSCDLLSSSDFTTSMVIMMLPCLPIFRILSYFRFLLFEPSREEAFARLIQNFMGLFSHIEAE